MTDLYKAAEMALQALEFSLPAIEDFGSKEQLTDCHRAIMALYKSLAQPEQVSIEPPDYVEPLTSDYHDGWEEGFEAAKNLFKKESAPQNADPRLLLGRKDNCTALAQPEQEPVDIHCPSCLHSFSIVPVAKREWVGLHLDDMPDEHVVDRSFLRGARWAESKLKEKNT